MATKKTLAVAAFEVVNLSIEIQGLNPGVLFDNGANADPTSSNAAELSRLKDQAKTSDSAREEYVKSQLIARTYFNDDGYAVIPANMLQAAYTASVSKAGVKIKEVSKVKQAVTIADDAIILVGGKPITQEDILNRHKMSAIVTNANAGGKSVIHRPYFKNWTAIIPVEVESDLADARLVGDVFAAAGRFTGIGCWRPSAKKAGKYGRFIVVGIK